MNQKCSSCSGCGYVDTWQPDYRGGTICTGAVRCLDCNGYGKAAGPVVIDLEKINECLRTRHSTISRG